MSTKKSKKRTKGAVLDAMTLIPSYMHEAKIIYLANSPP
jgi:hypothetical protein